MVEVIPGINGKAVRIGIERGLVQFWIVANVHSKDDGQLILIPPREFASAPFDREYHGENWSGGRRSMTVASDASTTALRQHAPSGSTLGSITVESHKLHQAISKFVPGFRPTAMSPVDVQILQPKITTAIPTLNPAQRVAQPSSITDGHREKLTPDWFWKNFRRELAKSCTESALSSSPLWTRAVTAAATTACEQLGDGVIVQHETPMRLDVSARLPNDTHLAIAFESELAPVGYMGRTHVKTWREEFVKLCGIPAHLRVLSSYFMPGTGSTFEGFLRRQLDELIDYFKTAAPSEWLLVFGSENSVRDPDQPWLALA